MDNLACFAGLGLYLKLSEILDKFAGMEINLSSISFSCVASEGHHDSPLLKALYDSLSFASPLYPFAKSYVSVSEAALIPRHFSFVSV